MAKTFEGENDKVKFMTLMCGDEDEKCIRAAAGALAILTSESKVVCKKITQVRLLTFSAWLTFNTI